MALGTLLDSTPIFFFFKYLLNNYHFNVEIDYKKKSIKLSASDLSRENGAHPSLSRHASAPAASA